MTTLQTPPAPPMQTREQTSAAYHLHELEIARNADAPGHLLPRIPPDCQAILDIGCGAGQTLIASMLRDDVVACGVDPDVSALSLGRTLSEAIRFSAAIAEALPFASDSFDFVFSRVALPYSDIPRALREIARVLRPGRELWISLHPPQFAWRTMRRAILSRNLRATVFPVYALLNGLGLQLFDRQVAWPFGRRRYESVQTIAGIRRALLRAGFKDVRVTTGRFFVVTARKR